MKSEFALAFNQICAEYNLPRDTVLEAVSAALITAYRRDWKVNANQNLTAEIDMDTGLARIFLEKMVVETVEDSEMEISLQAARRVRRTAELDDMIMVDVTPRDFGRIAAQTAKQVITQRLREAERESQFNRFSRQSNEIIIGTIQSITPQGITLHLERREEAHMPKREQIPGERYRLHQKIRVYVIEVRRTPRGPQITVSRSHPAMLRRLLELEVPEIRSGQVELKAIAREAGTRSKVAVMSRQPGLDPVGTCVGMRGIRIQTISRELNNERVDVVEWFTDPAKFIASALSLPEVLSVVVDPENPGGKTASVVVKDDQLSLAIGRSGQNARLAAKLTGWRVDIQGVSEAIVWALERVNQSPELLATQREAVALVPQLAAIMRTHEDQRIPFNDEELRIIRTVVEALRGAEIAQRERERPGSRQTRARLAAQQKAAARQREAKEKAYRLVPKAAYDASLADLELSEKVLGHLDRNGLTNVGQVMERMAVGDEELLMLNGVGAKALLEIKEAIASSAFDFIDEEEELSEIAAHEELFGEVMSEDGVSEAGVAEVSAEPETLAAEPEVVATAETPEE
ncbi:MAG: transcription termination/antitermination protein NusA, partial [Anaerolineae bacterium]|nr:transcription termination/antitermination protein NusA [Anaerolineae bacterium]